MPDSIIKTFTDPDQIMGLRTANGSFTITSAGTLQSDVTRIDLHRAKLNHGYINLPCIVRGAFVIEHISIAFAPENASPELIINGVQLRPGEMLARFPHGEYHARFPPDKQFGTLFILPDDLASTSRA